MIFRKRGYRHAGGVLLLWSILILFHLSSLALAHESNEAHEEEEIQQQSSEWVFLTQLRLQQFSDWTLKILSIAAAIATILVVISINYEQRIQHHKKIIFLGIIIPIILASLFLIGITIYGNALSTTKGPVHWHADYEVWTCGEKLDMINPQGMSNRVGTSTFHEHGDDRIHVEGVVHRLEDVALGRYFTTIGGTLNQDTLLYPTEQGIVSHTNGDLCPDGQQGILKTYVNGKKIAQPERYIITQTAYVPPGDCIIIDFSPNNAETTEKLCASWAAKGWTYER